MPPLLKPAVVFQVTTLCVATVVVGTAALIGKGDPSITLLGVGLAMWAPALARGVTTRTVDRDFVSPISVSLRKPSAWSFLVPLAAELTIYGAACAAALGAGLAEWSPRFEDPVAAVAGLGRAFGEVLVIGGVLSLGEELGWRGYLQPRLAATVRHPAVVTGLLWWSFHLPAVLIGGYQESPYPLLTQALFAISCIADSYLWGWLASRRRSVWPAVWFHCFHNFVSQGIVPSFVEGSVMWVGEDGFFPVLSHLAAVGIVWKLWARRPDAGAGARGMP